MSFFFSTHLALYYCELPFLDMLGNQKFIRDLYCMFFMLYIVFNGILQGIISDVV